MSDFKRALVAHQAHQGVKLQEHGHAVKLTTHTKTGGSTRPLRGLTARLRAAFYPHDPVRFTRYRKRALGLVGGSSCREGTRVHLWVRHRVNCAPGPGCSCPKRPVGKPPVYVQRFFDDMATLGFEPLQAEVPVWDKPKKLMTLLDVVVKTRRNTVAVLELKTGFNGSIDAAPRVKRSRHLASGAFPVQGPDTLNTFRHKHYLQALIGSVLYNKCYKKATGLQADEAWVVYLNDTIKPGAFLPKQTTVSWVPAHLSPWTKTQSTMRAIFDAL